MNFNSIFYNSEISRKQIFVYCLVVASLEASIEFIPYIKLDI